MLGLFGQPTCTDNCFRRGNKHLVARLVYGGAALGICLLSLYHGHGDNLAPTWSLIACPLRWQDGGREELKEGRLCNLSQGLSPFESTLIWP